MTPKRRKKVVSVDANPLPVTQPGPWEDRTGLEREATRWAEWMTRKHFARSADGAWPALSVKEARNCLLAFRRVIVRELPRRGGRK